MLLHFLRELRTRLTDTLPLIVGVPLCLVLVSALESCATVKKDYPPDFMICLGDGVGGADCDIPGAGEKVYLSPSMLKNFWITDQQGALKLTSWCYDMTDAEAMARMEVWMNALQGEQK